FLGVVLRLGGGRELELAEGLLELAAHAPERGMRLGGDHRPDELERQADGAALERREARRRPERVAEKLLVHVYLVALQLRVDRVTPAAEVDEVEEVEMLPELVLRDLEALDQLGRGDDGLAF